MPLYKSISIWKRKPGNALINYRCFQVLPDGKFCVQSADYYRKPVNEKDVQNHLSMFLELLDEEAPQERSELFDSVEEAIEKFDKSFENDP